MSSSQQHQPELHTALVTADGRAKFIFADNSLLLLSQTGNTFIHVSPTGSRTRQLSDFALRRYAGALSLALRFRNLHSDVPCMPTCMRQQLDPGAAFTLGYPIADVVWPVDPEAVFDCGLVEFLSAERIAVRSRCASGRIVLDEHRLRFAVCYPLILEQDEVSNTYTYIWHTQAFSAAQHPPRWAPALQIALAVAASKISGFSLHSPRAGGGVSGFQGSVLAAAGSCLCSPQRSLPGTALRPGTSQAVMPLPALTLAARALNGTTPISCSTGAQHAEAMPEEGWWYEPSNVLPSGEHVVLKWAQEATYVWLQSTGEVEAWLHADDSCMTTTQRGRFVQHFIPGEEDPRLYAEGAFPDVVTSMASGQRLEVGAVVANALKLRSTMAAAAATAAVGTSSSGEPQRPLTIAGAAAAPGAASVLASGAGRGSALSRTSTAAAQPPALDPLEAAASLSHELVEEQQVARLGHFQAFADGRVKVKFCDRTVLEMDAQRANCSLLLPDGRRARVAVAAPVGVEPYVRAAVEFAAWGFRTPAERTQLLRMQSRIQAELQSSARMAHICDWAANGRLPEGVGDEAGPGPGEELRLLPDSMGDVGCCHTPAAPLPAPTVINGAESPSWAGSGGIPAYRPGCCDSPPATSSGQPWSFGAPARPSGEHAAAGSSELGLCGDAGLGVGAGDGGGVLDQCVREQMVRQLLSRNAQVLQQLQGV